MIWKNSGPEGKTEAKGLFWKIKYKSILGQGSRKTLCVDRVGKLESLLVFGYDRSREIIMAARPGPFHGGSPSLGWLSPRVLN